MFSATWGKFHHFELQHSVSYLDTLLVHAKLKNTLYRIALSVIVYHVVLTRTLSNFQVMWWWWWVTVSDVRVCAQRYLHFPLLSTHMRNTFIKWPNFSWLTKWAAKLSYNLLHELILTLSKKFHLLLSTITPYT